MKRFLSAILIGVFLLTSASAAVTPEIPAPSAILMEKTTGTILCEVEAHKQFEPASVTKIMTLLLTFEALDDHLISLDQMVTASAHATSMGGSQIWLEENERISVNDLIKAVAVVSANDCAVALAELLAGSESAFVERMNLRAAELGMKNTTFFNCTGLPAEGHLTTAHDIALMSRELILHHPEVREYTTIWMDSLRNGEFQLSNTNKLIHSFDGATGLKTGFTDNALYCLSATAERDGMELIAVVMHADTSAHRFESAQVLLNWGFANYTLHTVKPEQALPPIPVNLGKSDAVQPLLSEEPSILLPKGNTGNPVQTVDLPDSIDAPISAGDVLGTFTLTLDGRDPIRIPLVAATDVPRLNLGEIFLRIFSSLFQP